MKSWTRPKPMRRFPAFNLPSHYIGVFQPDGGFIAAEAALAAMLAQARAAGAEVQTNVAVHAVVPHGDGVRISTSQGDIEARIAIVAAGPWIETRSCRACRRRRASRAQVMAWFEPRDPAPFAAGRFPVFLLESRHGVHYGFPPIRRRRDQDRQASSSRRDGRSGPCRSRRCRPTDEALIRAALADHIPAANGPLVPAKTCLYTVTPDHDFLIDRLPGAPNIIVASPCSGHGFKFAPVIGEILADLATEGGTGHDISRFRFGRFGC